MTMLLFHFLDTFHLVSQITFKNQRIKWCTLHPENLHITHPLHHTTAIVFKDYNPCQHSNSSMVSKSYSHISITQVILACSNVAVEMWWQNTAFQEHKEPFWLGSSLFLPFLNNTNVPPSMMVWISVISHPQSQSSCTILYIDWETLQWYSRSLYSMEET